ncbi:GNAT family N-acetyltransferase [Streptomyces sp. WAC 06725]|uniref:GNAT family N-acetyltransferase n=1 Tax=Streptomyces sp. WAC 06725 TaxID=2203209 RepID=UPI0021AE1B16|nr:GNAT family N-acetyltransferase [Streptomyces sp. WAC 06725]
MDALRIRPMGADDLASAERASALTFLDADRLARRARDPEPELRPAAAARGWIDRMRYYLDVDPGGCWVAVDAGTGAGADQVVGFAVSQNRDALWYLATYGVLPGHQGRGIGRRLLDAVLAHADGRPGIFSSSVHPGATRRYRLAGFSLHPQMQMVGTVDRSALPAVDGLRDGGPDDFAWMDRLDRDLRGAGHGPDHGCLLAAHRLVVTRDRSRPGYVYVDDRGNAVLLAAERVDTAQRLLWEALAASYGDTLVNCITVPNEWAIDVGLAAGLAISQEGYIAVRGMPVPAPYLAAGHFL